jgi:hypothetical protein
MEKLKSRKLWMAIASLVTVLLTQFTGLDPEIASSISLTILGIASTYILGQSYVDGKGVEAKGNNTTSQE